MSAATTVVFVHGAFADGSAWDGVIAALQARGIDSISVQNPLTSLADDAAHARRAIARAKGPVVLVGHSWGGAVITEIGNQENVKALVYVAAFAPAVGQSPNDTLKPYPASPGLSHVAVDEEGFITLPPDGMAKNFAQDLPAARTAVMAATQGPVHVGCFRTKVTAAAWEHKPSWYVVAGQDRMLPPAFLRATAERIGARTVEIETSHVPHLSHPEAVAAVIAEAVAA